MSTIRSSMASMGAKRREVTAMTAADRSRLRRERRRTAGCPPVGSRVRVVVAGGVPPDRTRSGGERLQEEQDQRDDEDVDREGLDQHETEQQHAADVAGGARVPRNRL